MYLIKALEFLVIVTYIATLSGAYLSQRDYGRVRKFDAIERSIIGFLVLSAVIHTINLFR
jgi:hypothetical protein